jgi:hypothetical protein
MPFLHAHEVTRKVCDLSGRLAPASVRDQMLRADGIIVRAHAAGYFRGGKRLLVVGGGASGLAAALRAIQLEIPTLLVEQGESLVQRQVQCPSREIDVFVYDFPAGHWKSNWERERLFDEPAVPLNLKPSTAEVVGLRWIMGFNRAVAAARGLIEIRYSDAPVCMARALEPDGSRGVCFESGASEEFSFVFCATGFVEQTTLGTFRSFAFWEADAIRRPHGGLRPGQAFVISGGGDGALQDYLRLIAKPDTTRELLATIDPFIPPAHLRNLADAEDAFSRSYIWAGDPSEDQRLLEAIHERYSFVAKELFSRRQVQRTLEAALRPDAPWVILVHQTPWFGKCYGVNRLLVMLWDEFFRRTASSQAVILPSRELCRVTCSDHQNHSGDPSECHGRGHWVIVRGDGTDAGVGKCHDARHVHGVILRHGAPGRSPLKWSRHILPYTRIA